VIPFLFLANPFLDPIPLLDRNAQFTYCGWGFHHFPAKNTTYAYSFMYFFHLCDPVKHKQVDIAYIAYHSLFKGEPFSIRDNYAQYFFETPFHILTFSYYSLLNLYKDH